MKKRDLRSITDLRQDDLNEILELAGQMKDHPEDYQESLKGKTMAMINEKQSLRTKVTFEAGIQQLGGYSIYLNNNDINLGKREPVKDIARNLSRWVEIVVARVYKQSTIEEMAQYATIPVVNALSDVGHPCQAIADVFTLWDQCRERQELKGFTLAYIGDGNNVCNSLMLTCGLLGMNCVVSTPHGYEPEAGVMHQAKELANHSGGAVRFEREPKKAVKSAGAVYTDVWTSMGQEEEQTKRLKEFADYQVNAEVMAQAPSEAVVMHCLPAHRGEEVTDEVLESEASVIFDQAENRLHAQKAIMKFLLDVSASL